MKSIAHLKWARVVFSAAFLLTLSCRQSPAYVPILTENDRLVHWDLAENPQDQPNIIEGSVEFFINRIGTPDIEDEGEGKGGEFDILRRAFRTWEALPTSEIDFNDLKLTDQSFASGVDQTNLILFDETNSTGLFPAGTGIIAVTLLTAQVEEFDGQLDGNIFDADIVFNGRDFIFGAGGEPARMDLLGISVHEVGHLCGLDHSFHQHNCPGGTCVLKPTMFPFLNLGETQQRELKQDDISGVTEIYPNDELVRRRNGSISGRVVRKGPGDPPEGTPLFGVDIIAYQNGVPIVSTITRTDGIYRMMGVPGGTYTLRSQVISPANVGLPQELAVDFQSEFYPVAGLSTDASPITVIPGRRRFDFNFELDSSTEPDFFEPNDSSGGATPLETDGARMIHQFYRQGDEDWVRFEATAGNGYLLETDNLSFFADPLMELFAPDGVTLLARNDDISVAEGNFAARISFEAAESGTHFVRLIDAGGVFGPGTSFEFSIVGTENGDKVDVTADGVVDVMDLFKVSAVWLREAPTGKTGTRKVESGFLLEVIQALQNSD